MAKCGFEEIKSCSTSGIWTFLAPVNVHFKPLGGSPIRFSQVCADRSCMARSGECSSLSACSAYKCLSDTAGRFLSSVMCLKH